MAVSEYPLREIFLALREKNSVPEGDPQEKNTGVSSQPQLPAGLYRAGDRAFWQQTPGGSAQNMEKHQTIEIRKKAGERIHAVSTDHRIP